MSQVTRFLVTGKLRFPLLLRCTQLLCAGNSLVHEGTPRKSGSCFVRRADLGSCRLATRVWINRDILIIWNVCAPPACAPGVRPWGLREWWVGRQKPRWCGRAPAAGRAQGAPHLALGGRKVTNRTYVSQVTRFLVTGKLRFPLLLRCTQLLCAGNSLVHEGTPRKSGSCFVRRADLGSCRLATRVWINRDILIIWNVCAPPACAPGVRPSPKPEAVAPSPGKEQTPETPVEARTHPAVV